MLRDRDILPDSDWNTFKDQMLPKVKELASKLEAEGGGDPENEKMLRCCREYLPAILEAGPTKKPPEWSKMQDAMTEATG